MELSGVSWTWQGVGRTQDKVKFRKKNFQDQGIERGVSDLFKVDPSIQLPETHKNFFNFPLQYLLTIGPILVFNLRWSLLHT